MTPVAAIDRLIHHGLILEVNLPSYRLEASKKRSKHAAPSGVLISYELFKKTPSFLRFNLISYEVFKARPFPTR